jgi:hypothetical protein
MFDTGLISPRRNYAIFHLHDVFINRGRHGAHSFKVPTDHPCHMPTVTRTRSELTYRDDPRGHIIGPRNKPLWPERLMASAALTGRIMIELGLPGVSWCLDESLL